MNTVTNEQIEKIMSASEIHVATIGDKTTMVRVVLPNGFELIETSSCVAPSNYDEKIGYECAMKRIVDHLWELEGYRLAWTLKALEGYTLTEAIREAEASDG